MGILYKSKVKKQILENIHSANEIIADINKCLIPANNIVWCNKLDLVDSIADSNNFELFNKNLFLILSHLKNLDDVYHINAKLCQDYPKLEEFSKSFFLERFRILKQSISLSLNDLKTLPVYKHDSKIKHLVKLLQTISKNIDEIVENIKAEQLKEKSL